RRRRARRVRALCERAEEAHRELAVVGHLPGREAEAPAARHRHRVLDVRRLDFSPEELEHPSCRIAHQSAHYRALRSLDHIKYIRLFLVRARKQRCFQCRRNALVHLVTRLDRRTVGARSSRPTLAPHIADWEIPLLTIATIPRSRVVRLLN